VKEKSNIFEELNKMKNLIYAKSGTVISEQADLGYDIATIQSELDKTNSDEQKIVDIVKKYKDKASFKQFVDQYKAKSGKDFGTAIFTAIQPYNDKTEWNDLSNHLKSMGITLGNTNIGDPRKGVNSATFTGLDAPAAPATGDRQKNINVMFCSVKDGIITNPNSQFKGTSWEGWTKTYKPTEAELAIAKKSCSGKGKVRQSGQQINDRFTKSAESLGIKGGKMDLQTLQSIIKTLESGETPATAATATPTGTPDLAQLTTIINQLNAKK
jgi:hypothetical protein